MAFARQLAKGDRKERAILRRAENEQCYGAAWPDPPAQSFLGVLHVLLPDVPATNALHPHATGQPAASWPASWAVTHPEGHGKTRAHLDSSVSSAPGCMPAAGVQIATNVIDEGVRAGEMAAEAGADFLDLNVGKPGLGRISGRLCAGN